MQKESFKKYNIFHWFLLIFVIVSIIFCLILIPLFYNLQSGFSDLVLEKSSQQLNAGTLQLENTVTSVLYSATVLSSDTRFIPFHYTRNDYTSISVNTYIQLRNMFSGLFYPLDMISDAALLFGENAVVTNTMIFYEGYTQYYPDFFCVGDLSFSEWETLLSSVKSGFLPIQHIRTNTREYDALIYTVEWENSSHIYVCMDLDDIKKLFVSDTDLAGYYLTISYTDGTLLYTDLPDKPEKHFKTLHHRLSNGNLDITIHIDNSIYRQKTQPMIQFLVIYGIICAIILVFIIVTGTHLSSQPMRKIIQVLEHSRNIPKSSLTDPQSQYAFSASKLHSGFNYIYRQIENADNTLEQYSDTLRLQQKILQARFLEKAINGQILSEQDANLFHTYFPEFPDSYQLLLFRLRIEQENHDPRYSEPLSLLQSFLSIEMPRVYQQQFSDSDLLLVISQSEYQKNQLLLDFMIENINREEPAYYFCGVISSVFQDMEQLPNAYSQIQAMIELSFPDSYRRVCNLTDYADQKGEELQKAPFIMTDLIAMYTAITRGDDECALEKLASFFRQPDSSENTRQNRYLGEMVCSVLMCIKLEHPLELVDIPVPVYNVKNGVGSNFYFQLGQTIQTFCDLLNKCMKTGSISLPDRIIAYIDTHYTDCELCLTSLEMQFHCSASTIRKVFKKATNTTVSNYIEQKRMKRAWKLLIENEMNITDIAFECGYSSVNSFYKAYRRCYGCAPTKMV